MKEKFARLIVFSLSLAALLLTACSARGIGTFARNSEWVTIVNEEGLFTVSPSGAEVHFISTVNDIYPPIFVNNGDTVVYVDQRNRLMAAPSVGGTPVQLITEFASPETGTLIGLPSGHVLFISRPRFSEESFLRVIDTEGPHVLVLLDGLGHIFITDAAIQRRSTDDETTWYVPYLEPGQLRIVLQSADVPNFLLLCSAFATGFECEPEALPRSLSAEDQALIDTRVPDDLRSGTLTSDGRRLVLRTQNTAPDALPTFSLWGIDLDSNASPIQFVTDAPELPEYSISPLEHQVVFEASGGLLGLYDFETGEVETLAADAWAPDWR